MSEEKEVVKEDALTPEQEEKMKKFEEDRKKRVKELGNVLTFLTGQVGLKLHKGLFQREKHLEFFRGVNFHVGVLSHREKVLQMIPSFIKEGSVENLKSIEDSIRLGQ